MTISWDHRLMAHRIATPLHALHKKTLRNSVPRSSKQGEYSKEKICSRLGGSVQAGMGSPLHGGGSIMS